MSPGNPTAAFLNVYAEDSLRGILAILVLAGCSDYNGLHREPLRKRFGASISRICDRAFKLATAIREGVMSASFEVVIVQPSMSSASGVAPATKKGTLFVDVNGGTPFDDAAMEDAFAGSLPQEEGRVLCTVELGLACARKIEGTDDSAAASPAPQVARAASSGSNAISRADSTSSVDGAVKVLDRNLLVKPKVMLDSVTKLLQL